MLTFLVDSGQQKMIMIPFEFFSIGPTGRPNHGLATPHASQLLNRAPKNRVFEAPLMERMGYVCPEGRSDQRCEKN